MQPVNKSNGSDGITAGVRSPGNETGRSGNGGNKRERKRATVVIELATILVAGARSEEDELGGIPDAGKKLCPTLKVWSFSKRIPGGTLGRGEGSAASKNIPSSSIFGQYLANESKQSKPRVVAARSCVS